MGVKLVWKGKECDVSLPLDASLEALRAVAMSVSKVSVNRIELRGPEPPKSADGKPGRAPKYIDMEKRLVDVGLADGSKVFIKDLGPQFSYRGVFIVEYLGPILIMLAFAARPAALFGDAPTFQPWKALTLAHAKAPEGSAEWNSFVQALAFALWVLHFVKRELETFFVHKFSRPTMPLSNLFKNSAYYWGFAAFVGFPLVHPAFTAPAKLHVALGAALWAASQLTNLAVHLQLSGMRSGDGDKGRSAPRGFLFSLVACPNYTAEVLGWVAWSLLSSIAFGWAFTLVGFAQMTQWALGKHRGYKSSDADGKYRARRLKAIVPFLI